MTLRRLALSGVVAALALSAPVLAEGPGSRLRSTPEVTLPQREAPKNPVEDTARCERLPVELMQRCLAEARASDLQRRPTGPESTGMGSGAGAGSTSGATSGPGAGGAGSGGTVPR
jgi:hypothetical protein